MSKKKIPPSLSENIKVFLDLQTQLAKDYVWNQEQLDRLDKLTQDYLHKLELTDTKYKEKAKIATELSKIRKKRREHKDSLEILRPFYNFLQSPNGKNMKNNLSEVLGQTRKSEQKLGDKKYWFRVLQEPPIVTKTET